MQRAARTLRSSFAAYCEPRSERCMSSLVGQRHCCATTSACSVRSSSTRSLVAHPTNLRLNRSSTSARYSQLSTAASKSRASTLGRYRIRVSGVGVHNPKVSTRPALQAVLMHQTTDMLLVDHADFLARRPMHAPVTIAAAMALLQRVHRCNKTRIFLIPMRRCAAAYQPPFDTPSDWHINSTG